MSLVHSSRRLLAVAPLAALLAIVAASSPSRFTPGITFRIRTQLKNHPVPEKSKPDTVRRKRLAAIEAARTDIDVGGDAAANGGAGGRGAAPGAGRTGTNNVLTMEGMFIKGRGRMEVLGVQGSPELTATQAALFTDTSSMVIDDVAKTWNNRVFDIGSILAFTSAVDDPNQSIGMLKVTWDSLPPETYEGRPAKHYQLKMRYGIVQPYGKSGPRTREDSLKDLAITDVTSDYWVVDLPVNFENRFAGIGRPRRPVPDSLRGEWTKMLALYTQLGKGTIVKFSATGIIGENATSTTEYTRTMEMTNIKAADVDETKLVVPADYTKAAGRGRGGI